MYLTVNNLNLSFENKKLYSDASFRILPGDKIGVVGSNGVGKTTLINVLCGNLIPDSGEIKFNGTPEEGLKQNLEQFGIRNPITTYNSVKDLFWI